MFNTITFRNTTRAAATLAVALTALSAHADNLNPILGGGLGAVAGAVIGQSLGGREGAVIGAAVGGAAGVTIASNGGRQREQVRTVVYQEPPRPAPVYGYGMVERINYYPEHDNGRREWGHHGHHGHYDRDFEERRFERNDGYRHSGEPYGWDRRH